MYVCLYIEILMSCFYRKITHTCFLREKGCLVLDGKFVAHHCRCILYYEKISTHNS